MPGPRCRAAALFISFLLGAAGLVIIYTGYLENRGRGDSIEKQGIKNSVNSLAVWLRHRLAVFGQKSRETVEVARLRKVQGALRKNIKMKKEELGGAVYQAYLFEADRALEKEYGKEVCKGIRKMEIEISKLVEKIAQLTGNRPQSLSNCKRCGAEVDSKDQYCGKCVNRTEE